jgi:TP901 family phage tail tape measure protein
VATLSVKIDPTQARSGARVVKREMGDIKREAREMERGVGRFGKTANDNFRKAARGIGPVSAGIRNLTGLMAPLGAAIAAAFSIKPLFAFKDALAEVSTLVDTTTFDMGALEKAALDQAAAFGGGAASQVKAFYQIISAGASSAAEATEILTAANKLAVGGVTDVKTAADGLTSVLNAYGDRVEGAGAVSDALFVGMRAGKTTIGELSSSLGKVAPLAAQTGVSFDELVASVSALTKGGIATTEAVTGVRAILAAVAKPTKEASDLAKALGLDFNAAALESKGLATFLQDLVLKTGGSTDALSKLFGGVEALVPIMALSGQAGQDFTAILEDMGIKAGQTEEAFNKMAASPGFQAGRVWSSLQAEVLGLTSALAGPLATALKFVADNMDRLVIYATTAIAIFGTRFVASLVAAAAATFSFSSALIFLRGALIRTGIGALIVGAGELVYQFSRLVEAAGGFGNALALLGDVAAEVWDRIKLGAAALVESLSAGWEGMKASFFYALHDMTAGFARFMGSVASGINSVFGTSLSTSPMEGVLADLNASGNAAMVASNTANRSARGLMADATAPLQSLEAIKQAMAEAKSETDGAADAAERLKNALGEVPSAAGAAGSAATGAGNKAKDAWEGLRGTVDKTAQAMAQKVEGAMKGIGGAIAGLINGTKSWRDVLGEVVNQMIQMLFNAQSLQSVFGGGGFGGLLTGIFGGLFGFSKGGAFDKGNVVPFANGGVVSKPTIFPFANGTGVMGEAGPEAIMPLKRGSNGRLGVEMHGNDNRPQRVEVVSRVLVSVDDEGAIRTYVQSETDSKIREAAPVIINGAVSQVNKNSAGMISDAQRRKL